MRERERERGEGAVDWRFFSFRSKPFDQTEGSRSQMHASPSLQFDDQTGTVEPPVPLWESSTASRLPRRRSRSRTRERRARERTARENWEKKQFENRRNTRGIEHSCLLIAVFVSPFFLSSTSPKHNSSHLRVVDGERDGRRLLGRRGRGRGGEGRAAKMTTTQGHRIRRRRRANGDAAIEGRGAAARGHRAAHAQAGLHGGSSAGCSEASGSFSLSLWGREREGEDEAGTS